MKLPLHVDCDSSLALINAMIQVCNAKLSADDAPVLSCSGDGANLLVDDSSDGGATFLLELIIEEYSRGEPYQLTRHIGGVVGAKEAEECTPIRAALTEAVRYVAALHLN